MNRFFSSTILVNLSLLLVSFAGCGVERPEISSLALKSAREGNLTSKIKFDSEALFDLSLENSPFSGQTYLSFMKNQVRPALNEIATNGYLVGDAAAMELAYQASDTKVKRKVDKLWGGIENVKAIAEKLKGTRVDLNTLPKKIHEASGDPKLDIYGLASFVGLASGGGVAIKYADKNYAFNIHYDVTEQKSGRSFGTGPLRGANDASDKQYLDDLEHYVRGSQSDLNHFYRVLFNTVLNTDPSKYQSMNKEGQALLTDFMAVYTAEQARNLMDGKVEPHWDAALLEVTLLASFHGGQEVLELYYTDRVQQTMSFTTTTFDQTPCANPSKQREAKLRDYWQFSKNITNIKNCKRSGINVTKSEFRTLGQNITSYMIANHPAAYEKVSKNINAGARKDNVFEALSYFLISDKTPSKFTSAKVKQTVDAWVEFLETIRNEADRISFEVRQAETYL